MVGNNGATLDVLGTKDYTNGAIRMFQQMGSLSGTGTLTKTGLGEWRIETSTNSGFTGALVMNQAFSNNVGNKISWLNLRDNGTLTGVPSITLNAMTKLEINDNTTANIQRLKTGVNMTLAGGQFRISGNSNNISAETMGTVTVNQAPPSEIVLSYNGSGQANLYVNNLVRQGPGAALVVTADNKGLGTAAGSTMSHLMINSMGGVVTANQIVNGILPVWLTTNPTETGVYMPNPSGWATYTTNGVAAYTAYNTTANINDGTVTATSQSSITANTTLTSSKAIGTLKVSGSTITNVGIIGGQTLTLAQGGLLIANTVNSITLGNAGSFLTAGDGVNPAELMIYAANAGTLTTTISSNIIDNGTAAVTLTKAGQGILTLAGTGDTYSGGTYITQSKLIASTSNALGTGAVTLYNALLGYNAAHAASTAGVTANSYSEIILGATPDSKDKFTLDGTSVIQGSNAQLAGLTIGQNATFAAGSMIAETAAGGNALVKNLPTNASLVFGLGQDVTENLSVGGTASWKGISTDMMLDHTLKSGTITANGDFFIRGYADDPLTNDSRYRQFTLGNGTGTTNAVNITALTPITVDLLGRVTLNSDSSKYSNVTFAVRPDSYVILNRPTAMGTTGYAAAMSVYAGGQVDAQNAGAISGNILVNPQGMLMLSASGYYGAGTATLSPASILRITNASALVGSQGANFGLLAQPKQDKPRLRMR